MTTSTAAAVGGTNQCKSCHYAAYTVLFDLCKHQQAEYSINGKVDWRTQSHMMKAQHGNCVFHKSR